jgi:hypothetical protein
MRRFELIFLFNCLPYTASSNTLKTVRHSKTFTSISIQTLETTRKFEIRDRLNVGYQYNGVR